jgi:hypothetical protein
MEERIMRDPILARHFDGLETPSVPELIRDPFDILSTHWLRTSHRLVRTVDAAGVKCVVLHSSIHTSYKSWIVTTTTIIIIAIG